MTKRYIIFIDEPIIEEIDQSFGLFSNIVYGEVLRNAVLLFYNTDRIEEFMLKADIYLRDLNLDLNPPYKKRRDGKRRIQMILPEDVIDYLNNNNSLAFVVAALLYSNVLHLRNGVLK